MSDHTVGLREIEAARDLIAGHVLRTPLVPSYSLSESTGRPVYLKLEHHQITGSFKLRGATNALLSLSGPQCRRGVVAASTGNHGRGLAHACKAQGVRCVICMSSLVPRNKLEAIERLGAEIRIIGASQDDAQMEVDRLVREEGMVMLPPFDHPGIIAGQGTIGLEIVDDLPEIELLLVQLSGGGLAAGIAAAMKARLPKVRVIGVSMERGAAMALSLKAGHPVPVDEVPTLADSLGGGIGLDNRHTFTMIKDLIDDVILLSEEEIAAGIVHAYREEREIVEGGGAVAIAAVLAGKARLMGPTVLLLSGKNIAMDRHQAIIAAGTGSQ